MADFSQSKSSIHEERAHRIRLLGTGAANPTIEVGQRIAVTRTGVGVYRIDWLDYPGTFVISDPALGSLVAANTAGVSVTRGVPVTSAAGVLSITYSVWTSLLAARELAANEYIDLSVIFAATKVP